MTGCELLLSNKMTYFSSTPDLFSSYTSPTYDKVIPVVWVKLTHTPACTHTHPTLYNLRAI